MLYLPFNGPLAQLVEQETLNLWVTGSIPVRLNYRHHLLRAAISL